MCEICDLHDKQVAENLKRLHAELCIRFHPQNFALLLFNGQDVENQLTMLTNVEKPLCIAALKSVIANAEGRVFNNKTVQ